MATKTTLFVLLILGIAIIVRGKPTPDPPTEGPATTLAGSSTTPEQTTGTTPSKTPSTAPPSTPGTTDSANGTVPSSNGTTETFVTTTPTPEATTKPATTTPAPPEVGTWTVRTATDNKTCMMMSFKGTINRVKATPFLIPTTAVADSSTCNDDMATFVLNFMDENSTSVSVSLSFVMQDEKTSYMYSSSIKYNTTTEAKVQILFETPAGYNYQCDNNMVPFGDTYSLKLEELRLQPFSSFADDKQFGKSHSCVEPSSKGPNAAVITGLVLGFIIFILLIAVIVLYRKKSSPGRGYNNFS